jgi:hypothetical protein
LSKEFEFSFLILQCTYLNDILFCHVGKDYKIPNMEMVALERQGLLPIEVEAFEQAINFGNEFMEQGYVAD